MRCQPGKAVRSGPVASNGTKLYGQMVGSGMFITPLPSLASRSLHSGQTRLALFGYHDSNGPLVEGSRCLAVGVANRWDRFECAESHSRRSEGQRLGSPESLSSDPPTFPTIP